MEADICKSLKFPAISSDGQLPLIVPQVVKAGENEWTTFDVVFLPRGPGLVRDTLYIHTSHGTFDFKVSLLPIERI